MIAKKNVHKRIKKHHNKRNITLASITRSTGKKAKRISITSIKKATQFDIPKNYCDSYTIEENIIATTKIRNNYGAIQ